MTEEQKEKYANFLDKVSEILGLNKPVDILRLCAVTDEYLRPIEKHIAELEKKNAELKAGIEKLKCCGNCAKYNSGYGETPCKLFASGICGEWETSIGKF